jgi:GPH family glycoside/pentoside/hexuronide:cation symporter
MAFGAGISFLILDWVGLDQNVLVQSEHTIFMIRFLLAAIPIAGLIVGMFALARFPLTQEKMAQIRTQLEARRGKV